MIQVADELRASVLAVLLVSSTFVGAVALSETAAAAPGVDSSLTVDPSAVASNSTNTHSFTVNVTTTVDGTNDRLEIAFPDEFDLSTPSVTLTTNDSTNLSTGTIQVVDRSGDPTTETLEVELVDSGAGGADAYVDLTGSVSAAAPTGDVSGTVASTYDVGDDDGSTADVDTGTVSISTYTYAPSYDTATSSGTVYPGATVYLGQRDVTFGGNLQTPLVGTSGDAEGAVLEPPIPREQATGRYSSDGSEGAPALTVDTPRITTFAVENANGKNVSGGTVDVQSAGNLTVDVGYNFAEAEDVQITVEDPHGLEVTDEVLTGPAAFNGDRSVGLDLRDGTVGFYTVAVEGADDLDVGEANDSTTIGLLPNRDPAVHVDAETVVQGDDVVYDVSGSSAGTYHLLRVDAADFRENTSLAQQARIFRHTGDVVERGLVAEGAGPHGQAYEYDGNSATGLEGGFAPRDVTAAYAVVEVDDDTGLAVGSLESKYLDTSSITLDVSDSLLTDEKVNPGLDTDDVSEPVAVSGTTVDGYLFDGKASSDLLANYVPTPDADENATTTDDRRFERDEVSFDVEAGTVSLDSPPTYAVGSRVDLAGNASAGIDDVAVYVRNRAEFELVTVDSERTISVDDDGTFDADDVDLSAGNSILSLPGRYQFGVVDAAAADADDDGTVDDVLTIREFGSGTSVSHPIRVTNATLDASFTSIIDGQHADADDGIGVHGTATAAEDVLFVAVGESGNVVTRAVEVGANDTFEEDSLALAELDRGRAALYVLSLGRDDVAGNSGDDLSAAEGTIDGFGADGRSTPLTADQIRSRLREYTTDATGSDDALVTKEIRVAEPRTTIDSVSPGGSPGTASTPIATGETIVVTGSTNRHPDDAVISVELRNASDSVRLASTDDWGSDGQWSVDIDTDDVDPGTYSLVADDGDTTDVSEVELVETRVTATAGDVEATASTATTAPESTATTAPESTATAEPASATSQSPTQTPTRSDGPGFGAIAALLALVAVSLLASRR
jgi:major cell surface glycoprotein (TIGR04216 family)